jgi:hypothetical protein
MYVFSVFDVTLTGSIGRQSYQTATLNKPAPTFEEASQRCMTAAESASGILLYMKT